MPLRNRLLLSLALPMALAIAVTMLWFTKKKGRAETVKSEVGESGKKKEKVGETAESCTTAQPTEERCLDVHEEEEDDKEFNNAVEAPSSAAAENLQQDSGVDVKLLSSSERKDSSNENESTSDGSVDSSSLICFSTSPTTASPPPGENGNHRRSSSQNGDRDVWELEFPQILCGRLIGRKGKNVKVISEHSGAKIRLIPQAPGEVSTHRIISIVGTHSQIQSALEAIHERFPTVPLTRLNQSKPSAEQAAVSSSVAPFVQAVLPSVANFEVVVTSVLDASHFFVQLHSDIMQQQLQDLHQNMLQCYGQGASALLLPMSHPIVVGSYCAAPAFTYDGWYRAQVLGPTGNQDEVEVKYLDYGGYGRIAASSLQQLRPDYLSLPFQAIECYLANVVPLQGDTFSSVAGAVMEDMTMNHVISARVFGQRNGLPCLELYLVQGQQTLMINRELVTRGLARWVETPDNHRGLIPKVLRQPYEAFPKFYDPIAARDTYKFCLVA